MPKTQFVLVQLGAGQAWAIGAGPLEPADAPAEAERLAAQRAGARAVIVQTLRAFRATVTVEEDITPTP